MFNNYSSIREGKLLQKVLKSRAQRNQRFSSPFFAAARKIARFESSESIFDGGQRNHIILKCAHKFLVNEFDPMFLEKEIFHHYSLIDSIHPNIHNAL
jgi:hypothetical protein